MDGDESGLNSYYHHHNHNQHHQHHHSATANSGTNGLFSNPHHHSHHHNPHHFTNTTTTTSSTEPAPPLIFPQQQHSVVTGRAPIASSTPPPPPPPPETVRRKRGRPRKYGTSESSPQSATASTSSAKNSKLSNTSVTTSASVAAAASLAQNPSSPRKKDPSSESSPTSSKKSQLLALGNAGQGFTPHVITVAAGEDVAQKIMSFTQQRKRAVCILSASGSVSNASLRQPATLGGNVTYEGRFEILSLSGSFLHNEIGGSSSRTGGLSVCLSGTDGRIVGGGVGGPLKAAGPVQVIAGSFVFDAKSEVNADIKIETSANKLPQGVIGTSLSGIGFRSTPDSSGRNSVRNDDHQHIVGSSFMLQPRGMHLMPSRQNDWRTGLDGRSSSTNIELAGTTDLESCQSPEDGDDEHLQD